FHRYPWSLFGSHDAQLTLRDCGLLAYNCGLLTHDRGFLIVNTGLQTADAYQNDRKCDCCPVRCFEIKPLLVRIPLPAVGWSCCALVGTTRPGSLGSTRPGSLIGANPLWLSRYRS